MAQDFSNCSRCGGKPLDSECPIYGDTVNACPLGDEPDWSAYDDAEEAFLFSHEDGEIGRFEAQVRRARWGEN